MGALYKLTALKVRTSKPGKYSDGGGLWLHRRKDGGAQWFQRIQVHGRRREMGLGSLECVSLKEAREQADHWRAIARQGKDPIKERGRLRREAAKDGHTLEAVAREAFKARQAELKGDGKAGRWFSPLEIHVLPKLGKVPIEEIDQQDIRNALAPIWHSKGETAKKAIQRLGIVIQYGAAMGLDVDVQATTKAKALLGKSRQEKQHIPAMAWVEVPAFYASLDEISITHLAFRLLILTTVRSTPIRELQLDQISEDVWTIPGEVQKGRRNMTPAFSVPLSTEAQKVIEIAKPFARDGYLFPGQRKGVISDGAMLQLLNRRGIEARPHGFRSSFRDWCAETTDVPREIAEKALSHKAGDKVELSYRRTDYLEKRRILMERWAQHVTGKQSDLLQLVAT